MTYQLVLIRHGESVWNLENRFTGWTDVGLTERGAAEALSGAKALNKQVLVSIWLTPPCSNEP